MNTPEQTIGDMIGRIIGGALYYALLRRMGAPKYIAFIATGVNQRLYEITHPLDDEEVRSAFVELIEKYRK